MLFFLVKAQFKTYVSPVVARRKQRACQGAGVQQRVLWLWWHATAWHPSHRHRPPPNRGPWAQEKVVSVMDV
jgi:hypothetical protein